MSHEPWSTPQVPPPQVDESQRVALKRVARPAAIVAALVLVAVSVAGAFFAGSRLEAPAKKSAAEQEIESSTTARVESRVVQEGLQVPGTVSAPPTIDLKLAGEGPLGAITGSASDVVTDADSGKSEVTAEGSPRAERNVISRVLLEQGQHIGVGSVLAEVSGRPVIAAPAEIPLYRDFLVGISGADVLALQQMLADLGYPVDLDGVFDADTLDAAAYWYGQLGYDLPRDATGARGVPWREFLPLPTGSLTVSSPSGTGTVLGSDTALAKVQRGDPVVEATVDAAQASQIRAASKVFVLFDGTSAATEVLSIGDLHTDDETGVSSHTVKIRCPETLAQLQGGTAVAVATAKPETPSLAVPLVAVDEDSRSQFVLLADEGAPDASGMPPTRVDIEALAVAGGWVSIAETPELAEGTEIRVR